MKRVDSFNKKECLSLVCCALVLLLLAGALWMRTPYGFDWTDEPYYTALPYRLALGDRPFVDAWEVHQLSALIALLFLRLYLLINGGSTVGVILYFRYVLIAVQMFIAFYGFFVIRKRSGNLPGLLVSALLLLYAHYGINSFSYNMMAPLFAALSGLLLFDAFDCGGCPVKLFLSGAVYGLSVMAQPYFIVSLPVWIVFWALICLSKNEMFIKTRTLLSKKLGGRGAVRGLLVFTAGGLFLLLIVAGYVFAQSSLSEIAVGIAGMLGDPDHEPINAVRVLGSYINGVRVLFGPCSYLALSLCLFGAGVYFVKDEAKRQKMRRAGAYMAGLLVLLATVWVLFYQYPDYHKINLAAMIPALAVPGLYFCSGKKPDRSLLLFLLGCALSLAVQLGSNTRIRASSGALLPASLGGVLYLFDGGRALFPERKAAVRYMRLCACSCACAAALMGGLRMVTTYREDPIDQLDTRISQGPGAGIVTTGHRAEQYDRLYADITENAPDKGRILVTNLMPAGYLMTELPPAAPSVFNMMVDAPWLAAYYEALPDHAPAYVFAVGEEYGESNDGSLAGTETLTGENGWRNRRLTSGTAFLCDKD